jgi:hypothetical protein
MSRLPSAVPLFRLARCYLQQGGLVPSWHTTVVPESRGTTTVVFSGGGGLLLLTQPASMQAAINTLGSVFITTPLGTMRTILCRNPTGVRGA